jgi:hypothetical protein
MCAEAYLAYYGRSLEQCEKFMYTHSPGYASFRIQRGHLNKERIKCIQCPNIIGRTDKCAVLIRWTNDMSEPDSSFEQMYLDL